MNGAMPSGNHHFGHGNSQRLGPRLHLHSGEIGAQTKRVSVLIGNRQAYRMRQGSKICVETLAQTVAAQSTKITNIEQIVRSLVARVTSLEQKCSFWFQ